MSSALAAAVVMAWQDAWATIYGLWVVWILAVLAIAATLAIKEMRQ